MGQSLDQIIARTNAMDDHKSNEQQAYSLLNGAIAVYTAKLREFHTRVVNIASDAEPVFAFVYETEKGREEYADAREAMLDLITVYDRCMKVGDEGKP